MLNNLLFKVDPSLIGDSALYALLGFLITFAGIALLILIVWLVGLLMPKVETCLAKADEKKKAKKAKKEELEKAKAAQASSAEIIELLDQTKPASDTNELDEETVAVITAAIMAYYQNSNPKCEFTIKRIKRI